MVIALVRALALTLCLVLAAATGGSLFQPRPLGNFYSVIPHGMMVTLFGAVFGFAAIAMAVGVTRFWRSGSQPFAAGLMGEAVTEAAHDALTLKHLDGGRGEGCNNEDDSFSMKRRLMHHLTFYGFMLCFAATCLATVYHYGFGWHAPYSLTSLPVLLGSLGGTGLLLGPAGLLILNLRRHPMQGDPRQRPKNMGFIALLLATSTTGLGLLALRETAALREVCPCHLSPGCATQIRHRAASAQPAPTRFRLVFAFPGHQQNSCANQGQGDQVFPFENVFSKEDGRQNGA
jgi:citrate/tricarballylate utilization protein